MENNGDASGRMPLLVALSLVIPCTCAAVPLGLDYYHARGGTCWYDR
jgi:hypothetical protein